MRPRERARRQQLHSRVPRPARWPVLVVGVLLSAAVAAPAAHAGPASVTGAPAGLVQWTSPPNGATVVAPRELRLRLERPGLPNSDEHVFAGQPRSDVEHGHIRWSPQTGAVVTYL